MFLNTSGETIIFEERIYFSRSTDPPPTNNACVDLRSIPRSLSEFIILLVNIDALLFIKFLIRSLRTEGLFFITASISLSLIRRSSLELTADLCHYTLRLLQALMSRRLTYLVFHK